MTCAAALAEAARLRGLFEAAGARAVEAAILQPAETLLDLYGEDIRARAYVTQDPLRGEMMLRPDFTVPVVVAHLEAGAAEPARYTYAGPVFRKQEIDPDRPTEYLQVGLEIVGGAPERADAEVFALLCRALEPLGLRAATGDIGILSAAVEGLSASSDRRAALMRHIWRPRRFRALMDRFAGRRPAPQGRTQLLRRVAAGVDPLGAAGPVIGLRSEAEIRVRIDRLAADAAETPLPVAEVALLDHLLALKGPCPAVLEDLRDLAVDLPAIGPAVARFATRLDAFRAEGLDPDRLDFEGSFGRTTLEYYDGFVFGFAAPTRPDLPPVATGGRYDALVRRLGQGRAVPAVGGVIRPELALALAGGRP